MVSHRKIGGLEISIGGGGLRFKKRPSAFNICIGKQLKGTSGPTNGGRYDKAFQQKFTSAVKACSKKAQPTPEKTKPLRTCILSTDPLLS